SVNRLRRNRLLASQLARLSRPHRSPRAFHLHQVLAPLPRLAPASQINFSGLSLNITAGLPVIQEQSGNHVRQADFPLLIGSSPVICTRWEAGRSVEWKSVMEERPQDVLEFSVASVGKIARTKTVDWQTRAPTRSRVLCSRSARTGIGSGCLAPARLQHREITVSHISARKRNPIF